MGREKRRCWVINDKKMQDYHDFEWGNPIHDDTKLFEFLALEGAQAGLSWSLILNKRESYRNAFDHFDFEKIYQYDEKMVEELLNNPGIVRNRLKINAFITNAKAFMKIREEFGSFDKYIWNFVDNTVIQNDWHEWNEVPSKTDLSERISKDLKKHGFKFVGPVIIYSFMQAVGLVDDHLVDCFRKNQI